VMSSVDCKAEEINTVNESASMVPDPYLQRAEVQQVNIRGASALTARPQDVVGVSSPSSQMHGERPCGLDRHDW
jgi:hypothetical protein